MKRYLQCAEQQVSLSKLTKYCACHAKWISWLILDTNETLFTMRGATCVIVQTHQILRLPRKMTVPNLKEICWKRMKRHFQCAADPRMIRPWSEHDPTMKPSVRNPPRNRGYLSRPPRAFCIEKYNISRSGYHSKFHRILRLQRKVTLTRTSPNTAPATKNESHDWSLSHMKRYLQCAEQQVSLSKLTKYCACHAKWISWLILDTNETLFTMRGATCVIVQTHQILRLPRKMTVPNLKEICWKRMKRHFQCAADPTMIRAWSENDPRMIRPWNRQSATRLATEVTFHAHHEHFVLKNTTFRAPAIIPNFTEYCACHEKWHLNFTKYCACHEKWHLHFTKYCACHEKWHFNFTKYCTCHENRAITWLSYDLTELWLDWAVTWLSCDLTELWLDWAVTWLSCDLTELWLDWAVTWLSCDLTELWLDWAMTWLSYYLTELWLDWAVTWLSCDLTELWRDWAVTWLSCDVTELWLDWTVTWLSCDLTELWLDWAVTWLSCDLTELWLDWAVTWLSCDLTELWLDWAVTWLSCDVTELWLDWTVTWLSCDLTELWRDWAVTWLNCDLTELWLDWAVTWLSCDLTELRCDVVRISEVSQPKLP